MAGARRAPVRPRADTARTRGVARVGRCRTLDGQEDLAKSVSDDDVLLELGAEALAAPDSVR